MQNEMTAKHATFPQPIKAKMIDRGHYKIVRADGHQIEVKRGVGRWFDTSSHHIYASLSEAKFDMQNGHTSHDICARLAA